MNSLIQNSKQRLQEACQKYSVDTLHLFGSAASDDFRESSDIDFLVQFCKDIEMIDFADNYFELQKELEDILGKRVDLVLEQSLENPYLKRSISRTKKLIYDRRGKEVFFKISSNSLVPSPGGVQGWVMK